MYINTDLTLYNIVTPCQPKNNIETTLKCLLGENSAYFVLKIVLLDIKFDWLGLVYSLVYPILVVVCGRMGQAKIGKPRKNMMRIVLKRGFSWLGQNLTEIVMEAGKLQVQQILESVFEMDRNWNQLDPGKAVCILKTIFKYFYYLVFQIHQFLRCMMFYIK